MTFFYFLFPGPGKRSRAWWAPIGDDMGTKLKHMHTVDNFFLSTRLRWMLTWCGAKPKAMLYDLLSSGGEQARIAEIGCCETYQIRILPWRLDHHISKHQCIFTVTSLRVIILQQQKRTPPSLRVFLVKSLFSLQQKYFCTPNPGQISLFLQCLVRHY